MLTLPVRFPRFVSLTNGTVGHIQPVIVVAEIGEDGAVSEAEVLQDPNSPLSRQVLEEVRKTAASPEKSSPMPRQRQWYINVRIGS